jgi:hypothetical protein
VKPAGRRALVLGPPLVLGLLELGHPGVVPGAAIAITLAPIVTWWTLLHVAQVPLFALLGLAVALLVRGLDGRAARISRGAVAVFVVVYPAFDAAVGVGSGVMLGALGPPTAERLALIEPALQALFWGPVTGLLAVAGGIAWVVALIAAAWAWRGVGAPWPVAALLVASGLLLGFSHIRPFGPLACGALLVAAGWIESPGARARRVARPA